MGSERFLYVLRRFVAFQHFYKFYGIPYIFGVFWRIIVGSEGFLNVPNTFKVSLDILECSVEFWDI